MRTFAEFFATHNSNKEKTWAATKKEIITHWRSIEPNQPIMPKPIPIDKQGSTYGYDGIRISGSFEFIDSVLSRFKDFLYKESPSTRLNLVFRQTDNREGTAPDDPTLNKYIFYVNITERGKGRDKFAAKKPKVPSLPKPKTFEI